MTDADLDDAGPEEVAPPRRSWRERLPWTTVVPLVALLALVGVTGRSLGPIANLVIAALLGASVLAAVHHAEVVAHRVGEPFGSLVLAVAVTVIEVGLILTLMSSGDGSKASLARDTVFAAVMITTNGILGLSVLFGALRHDIVYFNAEGAGAALATVLTLTTLSMVLPTFTTSATGPQYSDAQLAFAAVSSLALYALFVLTQTRRHRDFFLPVTPSGDVLEDNESHAEPPTSREAGISLLLLLASLVAVVGLAKAESPAIESAVSAARLPATFVGVIIALLVLAPETLAAVRAARRNRLQTSLNLALGSGIASIGLTIPVIAIAGIWLDGPLVLGLNSLHLALFGITAFVSVLTVVPGRATRLQGAVHLILLMAFVFLAAVP